MKQIGIAAVLLGFTVVSGAQMSGPAWAEGPAPFPEFEAKRIKPPAPGTRKRITVQIEPDQAPAPAQVTVQEDGSISVGTGGGTSPGRYAWFWDKISPELAQSGPGRTTDAFIALQTSGDVAAPRLQILQDIAKQRGIPILKSTIGTNVSPALVLAVISVESSGRADAVSSAGAQGLMQLMPQTAARFGVKDSLAPEDNIAGGVRYLDWLMQEFGNDPILALAGYNAGAGAVRKHDGVPPYAETRDYVPKVLAAFQVAKRLCVTPPELVSDGCVFSVMN